MSKAVWVDRNNDAAYHKLEQYEITDPYYDIRDPRLNLTYLNGVVGRGFHPGLYACSQGEGWPTPTTMSGPAWADWVYDRVQKVIAPGTMGSYPKVMLNCETHDIGGWIVPMLKRWRTKSPRRETYWTMEGKQGGILGPHVDAINACNVILVPQGYRGDMELHTAGVAFELLRAGFAPSRISMFWDAAHLPYNWGTGAISEFAYTQGRLP
jgi:hypothetical protein